MLSADSFSHIPWNLFGPSEIYHHQVKKFRNPRGVRSERLTMAAPGSCVPLQPHHPQAPHQRETLELHSGGRLGDLIACTQSTFCSRIGRAGRPLYQQASIAVWIREIQLRIKLFAQPGCFSLCSINNNDRNRRGTGRVLQ